MLFGISTPPPDILWQAGPLTVYYYGVIIAFAIAVGFLVSLFLASRLEKVIGTHIVRHIDALFLWVCGAGVVGGRVFFVAYHWNFFLEHPSEIIAVWHGGWVWHGALFFGLIALGIYCVVRRISFLMLAGLLSPGVILGQAIGRWGNYFNQEAYGPPLQAWWAIPIDLAHRLTGYERYETFHPAFLYESIGDVVLFSALFCWVLLIIKKIRTKKMSGDMGIQKIGMVFFTYLIVYSVIRFGIEFFRIDTVPVLWGLRAPQWVSIDIICITVFSMAYMVYKDIYNKNTF
ncbi:prolipoprotein diacylglyceryl transferase [Candidatus Uhrbacteria bacterium]|nr:prolipoprotein diacylglyceryl transferase [Candidatus Uhrbacteria bacterium]